MGSFFAYLLKHGCEVNEYDVSTTIIEYDLLIVLMLKLCGFYVIFPF